jgi:ankyrin repeat protein
MLASEVGNLDMVTLLVEQGASLTTKTDTGWDVLHAAAESGNVPVLDYLLLHGMQLGDDRPDANRHTVLHNPAVKGHEAMVEAIVERLPSLIDVKNDVGLNPLQQSVLNHRLSVLKKLCDLGADINVKYTKTGGSLMHLIGEFKMPDDASEIVKYLLQKGIAIEAETLEGFTPLKIAASHGHTHAAAALLDNGANIESAAGKGGRAIDIAVSHGHAAMVELLISRGASITHLNSNGNTLLYRAVYLNHVAVVKVLLQRGAPVDALSSGSWIALHLACAQNKPEIIEILLQHGPSPISKASNNKLT